MLFCTVFELTEVHLERHHLRLKVKYLPREDSAGSLGLRGLQVGDLLPELGSLKLERLVLVIQILKL